jgi:hypothetical protein
MPPNRHTAIGPATRTMVAGSAFRDHGPTRRRRQVAQTESVTELPVAVMNDPVRHTFPHIDTDPTK